SRHKDSDSEDEGEKKGDTLPMHYSKPVYATGKGTFENVPVGGEEGNGTLKKNKTSEMNVASFMTYFQDDGKKNNEVHSEEEEEEESIPGTLKRNATLILSDELSV